MDHSSTNTRAQTSASHYPSPGGNGRFSTALLVSATLWIAMLILFPIWVIGLVLASFATVVIVLLVSPEALCQTSHRRSGSAAGHQPMGKTVIAARCCSQPGLNPDF